MNKLLAPSLGICILGLIACSTKTEQTMDVASELEVIDVLFCAEKNKLSLSVDEIYETKYPWIFNKETGELYERDMDKNELYPLEVFIEGESKFVYESKLNGNILEIKETEYFPVNETAGPKIILSPTTFEKDTTEVDNKITIAETNVIIMFFIFIYFPFN